MSDASCTILKLSWRPSPDSRPRLVAVWKCCVHLRLVVRVYQCEACEPHAKTNVFMPELLLR